MRCGELLPDILQCGASRFFGRQSVSLPHRKQLKDITIRPKSLRAQGQVEDAIGEFQRAHELEPNNAVIMFDLAYALREAGRNDEAARMFELALKADPSKYAAIEDWAYALKSARI